MELREERKKSGWYIELFKADKSISHCSVVEGIMRIGTARVQVGGIGGVGTLPEFRKKGYSRQIVEAAIELMAREGYDISFLHGIPDFYHKYGFVTCMAEHEFWLDTRDAERAPKGAKTRRMKKTDLAPILRIYNRDNATRTGSAWRDLRTWRGFPMGTWWTFPAQVQVVVDRRERVVGYVVYDDVDDCCRAAEVGGKGEDVFAAILHFLALRAVRMRRERVWANVPEDHPFAIYCREFGTRINTQYPRNGKGMGRIITLDSCMQRLLPELARRWGSSGRGESLRIRTDIGGGTLRWLKGQLVFDAGLGRGEMRLSQRQLMQLIMGYARPGDLVDLGRIAVPARKRELVDRLFPLQQAQLWWTDRF